MQLRGIYNATQEEKVDNRAISVIPVSLSSFSRFRVSLMLSHGNT